MKNLISILFVCFRVPTGRLPPMSITIELIDGILSPTTHASAEVAYKAIPLLERINGILSLTGRMPCINNHQDVGRAMLSYVLLRRDISLLCGEANKDETAQTISLLSNMEGQLTDAFFRTANENGSVRRQIAFCVAEICSSLTLLNDKAGLDAMSGLLLKIKPSVS